jgi:16S rRNA (cytosine1402-N4)-methyltransferase
MNHTSVLLPEVLHWFDLPHRKTIIDATLGLGGHTQAVLSKKDFTGKVIGIDQDLTHLNEAQKNLKAYSDRFSAVHMNFGDLRTYFEKENTSFDGILFDLGVASPHFDIADRGFSYQSKGPLDMRMDQSRPLTAENLLMESSEEELARIFFEYGEESLGKRIARRIVTQRNTNPLKDTLQLKELITDVYRSAGYYSSKKNPATKVFQALRIAVNDELKVLEEAIRAAVDTIQPGGRILLISYHSLEDRLVKQFFKMAENPCVCPPKLPVCACGRKPTLRILTKKAIIPSDEEISSNPRARSAKLRVAERMMVDS